CEPAVLRTSEMVNTVRARSLRPRTRPRQQRPRFPPTADSHRFDPVARGRELDMRTPPPGARPPAGAERTPGGGAEQPPRTADSPASAGVSTGERPPPAEGEFGEALGNPALRGSAGAERGGQRQVGGIGVAVELTTVEVVQIGVVGRPRRGDAGQLLPDDVERQLSRRALRGGSPVARNRTFPSSNTGSPGPGVSSWIGHRIGEITSSGAV